jgi:hypothetical protein
MFIAILTLIFLDLFELSGLLRLGKENMFLARQSTLKLIVCLYLSCSNMGFSAISDQDAQSYFRFLARINTASPLEHAGSHGPLGLGLGMGLGVYHTSVNKEILREHWRNSNQAVLHNPSPSQRLVLPRFYFHKGLPYAVDFGFSLAQDVTTKTRIWSGFGQWTPIEGMAMPALALRGGFSRCMGLAATDASSLSMDGVLSYGFLKLLTIYGTAGLSRHQVEVRSGDEFGTGLALTPNGYGSMESTFVGYNRSVGLQFQFLPGLATATTEVQIATNSRLSFAAKFSLGI